MKFEIPIRIRVNRPPEGVITKVQRGKDELLPPSEVLSDSVSFELTVSVDLTESRPNFLGKYAQGPKHDRFLYVNSGSYAGQLKPGWDRRAKLSLMSITGEQIQEIMTTEDACMFVEYEGTGRDGGPTCASVKGLEWKVTDK